MSKAHKCLDCLFVLSVHSGQAFHKASQSEPIFHPRLRLNGLHSVLLLLASPLSAIVLPRPIEIQLRLESP